MSAFRFSPIQTKEKLREAIEYIHFQSFKLCKENLGEILPVAGNIGVFCHYQDEFDYLIGLRKELTDISDNWNEKYFRLYEPMIIQAKNDIPETTYTYLYIRKPDPNNNHVGDVDFYMKPDKYKELKQSLLDGKKIPGVRIFERADLDLIRLHNPKSEVSAFIGQKTMDENVRGSQR